MRNNVVSRISLVQAAVISQNFLIQFKWKRTELCGDLLITIYLQRVRFSSGSLIAVLKLPRLGSIKRSAYFLLVPYFLPIQGIAFTESLEWLEVK